jgi:hypothetical protein
MVAALKEEIPVIGFTATDKYYSNKSLIPLLGNPWHTLTIQEAVDDGLIPPHRSIILRTDLDLSEVEIQNGNYNKSQLTRAIRVSSSIQAALRLYRDSFPDLTAIVSCGLNDEAELWATTFNQAGISAAEINGEMNIDERKNIIASVKSGKTKILCGSDLVVTGLDIPRASIIFNTPTCSAVVAEQRLGRVQRKDPENPEKISYSVDILPFKESRSRGCILVPDVLDGKALLQPRNDGKTETHRKVRKIERLIEGAGVLSSASEVAAIIKERKTAFGIGTFVNGTLISYPEQTKILSEMRVLADRIVNLTSANPIILHSVLVTVAHHSDAAAGLLNIFEDAVENTPNLIPKLVTSVLFDTRSELYLGILRLDEAVQKISEIEEIVEDQESIPKLRNDIRALLDKVWYLFHSFQPSIRLVIRDYSTAIRGEEARNLRRGLEEALLASINYLPLQEVEYFDRVLIKAIKNSIEPLLKSPQSEFDISPLPSNSELHLPCTYDIDEMDRTQRIEDIRALHNKFLSQQKSMRNLKAAELLFAEDLSASLKRYCDEMNYATSYAAMVYRSIRDRFISFGQEHMAASERYVPQFPLPADHNALLQRLYNLTFSDAMLGTMRAQLKHWTVVVDLEAWVANPKRPWKGFISLLRETSPGSSQRRDRLREVEYLLSAGYCAREKILVSEIPGEFSLEDLSYSISCGINFSAFALVDFGLRNHVSAQTILPFMSDSEKEYLFNLANHFCEGSRMICWRNRKKSGFTHEESPITEAEFVNALFDRAAKPWIAEAWSEFTEPGKVGPSLFIALLYLRAEPSAIHHKSNNSKYVRIVASKNSFIIKARLDKTRDPISRLREAGYSESFIESFNRNFLQQPRSFTPQREGYCRTVRKELYFNYLETPKSMQESEGDNS